MKNVLTTTGIYLAGDARVCLGCHRIDVHALVLQVTDCIVLLHLPIKSQRLAFIFKVCCSQVILIVPTNILKGLPPWQTSFLPLRFWVRFCTLGDIPLVRLPKWKRSLCYNLDNPKPGWHFFYLPHTLQEKESCAGTQGTSLCRANYVKLKDSRTACVSWMEPDELDPLILHIDQK